MQNNILNEVISVFFIYELAIAIKKVMWCKRDLS